MYHLDEEITDLLRQIDEQYQSVQDEPMNEEPLADEARLSEEQPTRPQVHVYIMQHSLEEQLAALLARVRDADTAEEARAGEATPLHDMSSPVVSTKQAPRRWWMLPCVLLALMVVLGSSVYVVLLNPFAQSNATVTIVPQVKTISMTTTLTLTPHTATNATDLTDRVLPRVSMTQVGTVQTTGTGHQSAQAAHGIITFYNAAPFAQPIVAGTLLTGTDGVQVVTDADILIPAGNFVTNGQMTVAAHAVVIGPIGNIRANDIYGACCRLNVFVVSSAFTGGQDARTFPMVAQRDLDTETATHKASLFESVTAALQAQLHTGETLLPPTCTPVVTPDEQVGAAATQLTVTVTETCSAAAYDTQALQTLFTHVLDQRATAQLGTSYQPVGTIQTNMLHVQTLNAQQGTLSIQVKATGQWAYQFTQEQAQQLITQLAGKSKAQATRIVAQQHGVQAVTITITGKDTTTLPTNTQNIHLIVLSEG